MDHLLSKDTLEIRPHPRGTRRMGPVPSPVPRSRRHRPRPHNAGRTRRLPAGVHSLDLRDIDGRSTDIGCRGGPSRGRPEHLSMPPSGGRGRPSGAAPPPGRWPVGSGPRPRAMLFQNPVVGSHTRQVQAQCGSGRFHPRTWTLIGSREALYRPREGRYSEARSVARRVRLRLMGSWSASDRGRVDGRLSREGGTTGGGAGSAWSSS